MTNEHEAGQPEAETPIAPEAEQAPQAGEVGQPEAEAPEASE